MMGEKYQISDIKLKIKNYSYGAENTINIPFFGIDVFIFTSVLFFSFGYRVFHMLKSLVA